MTSSAERRAAAGGGPRAPAAGRGRSRAGGAVEPPASSTRGDGRRSYRPLPAEEREAAVARGLAAYARGDFYLAHEELEPAWMAAGRSRRARAAGRPHQARGGLRPRGPRQPGRRGNEPARGARAPRGRRGGGRRRRARPARRCWRPIDERLARLDAPAPAGPTAADAAGAGPSPTRPTTSPGRPVAPVGRPSTLEPPTLARRIARVTLPGQPQVPTIDVREAPAGGGRARRRGRGTAPGAAPRRRPRARRVRRRPGARARSSTRPRRSSSASRSCRGTARSTSSATAGAGPRRSPHGSSATAGRDVHNVAGGMVAWLRAGLEVAPRARSRRARATWPDARCRRREPPASGRRIGAVAPSYGRRGARRVRGSG